MTADGVAIAISIAVGVAAARALFHIFFQDRDDFSDCLAYSFTPDLLSLFRGRLGEDWFKSTRLSFYLLTAIACGMVAYLFLRWLFLL